MDRPSRCAENWDSGDGEVRCDTSPDTEDMLTAQWPGKGYPLGENTKTFKETGIMRLSPSPNGPNGQPQDHIQSSVEGYPAGEQSPSTRANGSTRTLGGRFAPGNSGGPGNPSARAVGQLRAALLASVTEEDIRQIVAALVLKAKAGDIAAAKEVLDRTLGKPVEADLIERLQLLEQAHASRAMEQHNAFDPTLI